jgi:hypothetical protein
MTRAIFLLGVLLIVLFSCTDENNNNKIFNGELFIIENKPDMDTLYGEQIQLDGLYTGSFTVHDSLIVFSSSQYKTALNCISLVFNLKTGKQISSLIKVGKGPGEYTMATTTHQFHIDKEMKMWFYDYFVKKLCFLVDIVNNNVSDSIDISWLKTERKEPCSRFFILNDSLFLAYNMPEPAYTRENIALPPVWSLYNYKTGEKLRQYDVYNQYRYLQSLSFFRLYSEDRIKPDHTKFVMPMGYLHQINIVNIQTGAIKGYRFKDSPDYLDVMTKEDEEDDGFGDFYLRACVDDDFIYAVINKKSDNTVIDVFDWNGNYLKKIILDKKKEYIAIDAINKYIYILTIGKEEEIYRYDVSYLYKQTVNQDEKMKIF